MLLFIIMSDWWSGLCSFFEQKTLLFSSYAAYIYDAINDMKNHLWLVKVTNIFKLKKETFEKCSTQMQFSESKKILPWLQEVTTMHFVLHWSTLFRPYFTSERIRSLSRCSLTSTRQQRKETFAMRQYINKKNPFSIRYSIYLHGLYRPWCNMSYFLNVS